jgi:small-conductance mechanosensitive channel
MISLAETMQISSSPYINALLSLIAFIVIAKIADLLIDKVLRKFSLFTRAGIDDRIIDLIHRPIFYTIIIAGIILSVRSLEPATNIIFYAEGVLYSVLAVIWCIAAVRISNAIIERAVLRVSDITGMGKDIIPLVENVTRIVIIVTAVMIVLSIWQINITPIIASAGIAGAVVAFAAKDMIANFLGGISVFVDRPFKIGDYIVLDKGERGEVIAIGVRSTRIKTRDDVLITIPNSIVANSKIINESAPMPNFRVRIPVSVAYGSDIDLVQATLLAIAGKNEHVFTDPMPNVRFREFGESSLNFELLCWIKEPAMRGLMVHDLNCAVYKAFSEAGITIPFPQRDIHIRDQKR